MASDAVLRGIYITCAILAACSALQMSNRAAEKLFSGINVCMRAVGVCYSPAEPSE